MTVVAAAPPSNCINLARVLAGATPFKDLGIPNVGETYRGQILVGTSEVRPAIIKDIPSRELANELLATALGTALALPVPRAYLAIAPQAALPAKHAPKLSGLSLVFATADVASPSVASVVRTASDQSAAIRAAIEFLMKSGCLGDLYGFDSWVANVDRHVGNILLGGTGWPWLIDHGRCFTGSLWKASDLADPSLIFTSRLKQWLTPGLTKENREKYADDAKDLASKLKGVDAGALATENWVADLLDASDFSAVVAFLIGRVDHVPRIAADALDLIA